MLAKRIIPCLDVTAGRVVKGINFVNLRDAGDPVELADRYNQQGADELVFLDITASSDDRDIMADVVARTARKVFIPLTVGGGVRTPGSWGSSSNASNQESHSRTAAWSACISRSKKWSLTRPRIQQSNSARSICGGTSTTKSARTKRFT